MFNMRVLITMNNRLSTFTIDGFVLFFYFLHSECYIMLFIDVTRKYATSGFSVYTLYVVGVVLHADSSFLVSICCKMWNY